MPSVTRKAHPNRAQRRAEIEQQLLAATERLMGAGSTFTELSVDRLATEAGISRATFYIYFEDKGRLLRNLAQQVFGQLADGAHMWWDVVERRDPQDARAGLDSIIATYRQHQTVVTAVIEMAAYDQDTAEFYRLLIDDIIGNTETAIERGKADGSIRASLPTRETASGLTWLVERTVHQTARYTTPDHDGVLAQALTEIIWSTLYLEPATRPS
jgi:AcrR family transcriptional regulator